MPRFSRRRWLQAVSASAGIGYATGSLGRSKLVSRRIATFRIDVTPPIGHPLLGGSFRPAARIGDPLFAYGLIFSGDDRPVVVLTLDWCEIRNEAYATLRSTLAAAVDTTPDRVVVCSVHQHDAPYVDLGAQRILAASGVAQPMCDAAFFEQTLRRLATAAREAVPTSRPLTHLARSRAPVERIASNRRVLRGDGTPYFGRFSTCRDPALRAQPAGEIDPHLHSLTFYSDDRAVASLRSYAVHPMSPYGQGVVSTDFVGDARTRRQRDQLETLQIYATGCAGDVTAGKYNDGSPEVRKQLAERLYDAMVRADDEAELVSVDGVAFRSQAIELPFWNVPELSRERLQAQARDERQRYLPRAMAALGISSHDYAQAQGHAGRHRVDLQVVDFGAAQLALFPAESFVSFSLQVQQARPGKFIVPLGFGECAPGYIPTVAAVKDGFREEHGYCWVDDSAERRIVDGITKLV